MKDMEKIKIDSTHFFEINGDVYMEIQAEKDKKQLLKYNEKFNKWVTIQFMEKDSIKTEDKVIETLSSQYIESMINRR